MMFYFVPIVGCNIFLFYSYSYKIITVFSIKNYNTCMITLITGLRLNLKFLLSFPCTFCTNSQQNSCVYKVDSDAIFVVLVSHDSCN